MKGGGNAPGPALVAGEGPVRAEGPTLVPPIVPAKKWEDRSSVVSNAPAPFTRVATERARSGGVAPSRIGKGCSRGGPRARAVHAVERAAPSRSGQRRTGTESRPHIVSVDYRAAPFP